MQVDQSREDKVLIVSLTGRFDAQSAGEVESSLNSSMEKGEVNILVDMQGVEYISSAGLRVLLATAKKISAQKGKLVLCALRPYVQEVFEVAGFNTIFQITQNTESAMEAF
ncbi:STAS domain-containing protein [Dethiosulfatarculus sandiegensis]|uniref:Anti-sigma factor antagonist n=1 Tax=Dethiosulfatarculus sandiegensis TaxID=1429043 RepID=A0A0D2GGV8_9BACT|nr:STAS domain-containing protein [Dethiosulfatarculus sandiegensis]KIX14162.1 anti-anti-sigma factor [Dethiosulfatarculus sandiegensis]